MMIVEDERMNLSGMNANVKIVDESDVMMSDELTLTGQVKAALDQQDGDGGGGGEEEVWAGAVKKVILSQEVGGGGRRSGGREVAEKVKVGEEVQVQVKAHEVNSDEQEGEHRTTQYN